MSNLWCHTDLRAEVDAPLVLLPTARDKSRYLATVAQFANQARYVMRDVTGDGKLETFCNHFAHDVMRSMSVELPRMLANQMIDWLESEAGRRAGWSISNRVEAVARAELGYPGLVTYQTMDPSMHGHIAVVVPSPVFGEARIAQAGRENFNSGSVGRGFGTVPVQFWIHN